MCDFQSTKLIQHTAIMIIFFSQYLKVQLHKLYKTKMLFRCGHFCEIAIYRRLFIWTTIYYIFYVSEQFHSEFKGFSFHCRAKKKEFHLCETKKHKKKQREKGILVVYIFLFTTILSFLFPLFLFLAWKIDGSYV